MMLLNVTTEYSLLKSLIKVDDLISFLHANNYNSCAICDDNLYGVIEFYIKCKKNNIKPIIGLCVKVDGFKHYLYAKNYNGYKRLLKINTLNSTKDLTYEDITDKDILIVVPYSSLDQYGNIPNKDNVYLGYNNIKEKNNVMLLSNNVVFSNEVCALKEEDIFYLEYLKLLNPEFEYDENSFVKVNLLEDDKKRLDRFASLIDLEIDFTKRYIPDYKDQVKAFPFLRSLTLKGLEKRLNGNIPKNYLERAEEELKVINDMGFVNYFLIVYDYVLYAKKNGILVGPGRGSAAGSLISYAIGITDIDPIEYNLLFSRFLNPGRVKMPDIDIDFEDTKRMDVINYVKEKYGKDKVALGLTFSTFKSRLILRDLSKVLNINQMLFDKFIKCIDAKLNLKENYKNNNVKKYLELYPELKKLYKIALKFEGLKKNISTHASAVVISSIPLDDVIPIYYDENIIRTGIEVDENLEKLGFLKMDFLGVKNLTIIQKVLEKVGINIGDIPLDDKKVYDLFKSGNTTDIFQFESNYAKEVLKKGKPENFSQLCIMMALVRPGANNQLDDYIKNKKNNYEGNEYLQDILKETYGIIIYQEQVIKILEKIAGYNLYEADNIRAAISKKKEDIILKEEQNFINRSIKNGYEEKFASQLFEQIKKFAEYGFNKSHSVAYSKVSYILAYLKVNYPKEFSFVNLLLSSDNESKKKYLSYLKENGIKILKPNINYSNTNFVIKNNNLLLPFTMIKGMNMVLINDILALRDKPFNDIYDFFIRLNNIININNYKILVLSGCLDTFKINKQTLIENYDVLKNYAELAIEQAKPILKQYPEYEESILRKNENEYYGIYIGNHPCSIYHNVVKVNKTKDYLFKNINMILLLEKITMIKTKKGDDMAFLTASDETGKIELTVFPESVKSLENIVENDIIFISGKSSKRFDKYQIVVNKIERKGN